MAIKVILLSTSNLCRDTASEFVQKDSSGERHDQENAHLFFQTLSVVHYEFILSKNNAYINFNFKSDEVELWHGWVMIPSRTDFPGLQVFENFTVCNIS